MRRGRWRRTQGPDGERARAHAAPRIAEKREKLPSFVDPIDLPSRAASSWDAAAHEDGLVQRIERAEEMLVGEVIADGDEASIAATAASPS